MGDDLAIKLLATTDAQVWAREFCRTFVNQTVTQIESDSLAVDPILMISWFANAIEVGRTAGYKQARNDVSDDIYKLREAIRLTRQYVGAKMLPAVPGWSWYDAMMVTGGWDADESAGPVESVAWTAWLHTVIGEAVGEASMCWEKVHKAGVFNSTHASRIVDEVVEKLIAGPPEEDGLDTSDASFEPTVFFGDDGFAFEPCSVEVWRWGRAVRVAIRSEESVGKCIELSLDEAADLASRLTATINADRRRIRDEPQV